MEVNILGRLYEVRETTTDTDSVLKDNDGYCDPTVAVCVVDKQDNLEADSLKDMESYKRQVTRHELIHAFLFESGLGYECGWACEEMVDWLVRQFPLYQGQKMPGSITKKAPHVIH